MTNKKRKDMLKAKLKEWDEKHPGSPVADEARKRGIDPNSFALYSSQMTKEERAFWLGKYN